MIEISDNSNIFSVNAMSSFYFNKDFHSRMSFDSDTTDYEIIRQRIETRKIDDIVIRMKKLLIFDRQQLEKIKQVTEAQRNKHRRDVIYEVDDQVWLASENIKTTRSCKDLEDKQLRFYPITAKVETFYRLQLSTSMRHIHSVFSLKILRLYLNDFLSSQHAKLSRSLVIENEKHWEIEDILNFRRYKDRLQYKIKWNELDRDNEWYYADKEKFDDLKEVLNEFHKLYLNKSH